MHSSFITYHFLLLIFRSVTGVEHEGIIKKLTKPIAVSREYFWQSCSISDNNCYILRIVTCVQRVYPRKYSNAKLCLGRSILLQRNKWKSFDLNSVFYSKEIAWKARYINYCIGHCNPTLTLTLTLTPTNPNPNPNPLTQFNPNPNSILTLTTV